MLVMLFTICPLALSIQEFIIHWMKPQGYFIAQVELSNTISRLFPLSIDIFQRKYCQQISFLSRSIFFPFAQLTGPGQLFTSFMISRQLRSPSKRKDGTSFIS